VQDHGVGSMLRHFVDEVEGSSASRSSLSSLNSGPEVPLGCPPFWLEKDCLGMLPMTMATRQAIGSEGTLPEDESLVLRASGSPSQIQSRD
jgi:hypothetical protein